MTLKLTEYFSAGTRKRVLDAKDKVLMWAFTLLYTAFTLVNLGSTSFPQTVWRAGRGEQVVVDLGETRDVSTIWFNGNIADGGQLQVTGDDGAVLVYDQVYGEMFTWRKKVIDSQTRYLRLEVVTGEIVLNEIAVFDWEDTRLPAAVTRNGAELLDEQATVPKAPSYYNGMYFDEIYHARTAYEFLHTMSVYEWTHPPLGKTIIALGVSLFGMTPFGWRIMPALFGAAMLPVMFILGKRMFRRRDMAFMAMALFGLDTMHYTQTRIATVDVFVVFFILLMFLFMTDYIHSDNSGEPLPRTLLPLGLCGVSFGLGVASKWTGMYAGAGLAVVFFVHLGRQYISAKKAQTLRAYWARTWKTIVFCCVFFLLIPGIIYYLSYIPFYRYEQSIRNSAAALTFREKLNILIVQQQSMYSYHSNLTATHMCQSTWYEWPFTARSVWYYISYDGDRISNISATGNPGVWWVSAAGTMALIVEAVSGKLKKEPLEKKRAFWILFAAIAANYLPWTLVPRCTFQYHYFPTVPFVILAAVLLVQHLEERGEIKPKVKWIWLGVAGAFFLLLLPACSGIWMNRLYARFLEYVLPSAILFHGAV